ncbi:MAG: hypothetical protein NUW01_08195 [Gemmatimonadaceae bacterium]|nr:hypothetical protein [Gemmatimonadaceae bacterium]
MNDQQISEACGCAYLRDQCPMHAAAPAMLNALRAVLHESCGWGESAPPRADATCAHPSHNLARAAIAQATGIGQNVDVRA